MSGFKYIESKRVSKAQKRRDAKAAKKSEQTKRIEEAEKLDEHKDRRLEQEKLNSLLESRGLKVHDIDADGDCLYKAVEHQLKLAKDSDECLTFQEVRSRTSQYMLENAERFMPFMVDGRDEMITEQEFKTYCNRIATTKEWGGHLELTAIASFTRKPIQIFQADTSTPIVVESDSRTDKSPILLSFHKHLYHLGEHYNSLVASSP